MAIARTSAQAGRAGRGLAARPDRRRRPAQRPAAARRRQAARALAGRPRMPEDIGAIAEGRRDPRSPGHRGRLAARATTDGPWPCSAKGARPRSTGATEPPPKASGGRCSARSSPLLDRPADEAARPGGGPTVSTLERFEKAAQLARLASDHAMFGLSAEAIRDALGAGPPVVPIAMVTQPGGIPDVAARRRPRRSGSRSRIHALDASWTAHQMPASLAYEALRAAVLPDARPGEVFLYPRPLALGDVEKPRSVGAILARRAVEAGQVDDLRGGSRPGRTSRWPPCLRRSWRPARHRHRRTRRRVKALLTDLADRLKRDPLRSPPSWPATPRSPRSTSRASKGWPCRWSSRP